MMENFYDYWNILPHANNNIGRELEIYLESNKIDLLTTVALLYLQKNLQDFPFPTYKMIKTLYSQDNTEVNYRLQEIHYNAFEKLLDSHGKVNRKNLYSLIASFQLSDDWTCKISENLLPKLVDCKLKNNFNSNIYLALIARSHTEDVFLQKFLEDEKCKVMKEDLINLKTLYLNVIDSKDHWISVILKSSNVNEPCLNLAPVIFFKIINHFNDSTVKICYTNLHLIETTMNSNLLNINKFSNPNVKFCSNEIQKLAIFLKLLKTQQFKSSADLSELGYYNGLNTIHCILKNIDLNSNNFSEMKQFFENNATIIRNQNEILKLSDNLTAEFDFLKLYAIMKLCVDKIISCANDTSGRNCEFMFEEMCHEVRNSEMLLLISETIFALLFLHSDGLLKTYKFKNHSTFICNESTLEHILKSLASALKQILDEASKQAFENILEYIDSALQKLYILKIFSNQVQFLNTPTTNYTKFFESPLSQNVNSNTEHDISSLMYQSQEYDFDFESEAEDNLSTDDLQHFPQIDIINKMLMDSRSLINVAVKCQKAEFIRKILQRYNLQSSSIAKEIDWLENLEAVRENLNQVLATNSNSTNALFKSVKCINSELSEAFETTEMMNIFEKQFTSEFFQSEKDIEFMRKYQLIGLQKISAENFMIIDVLLSLQQCKQNSCEAFYNRLLADVSSSSTGSIGFLKFLKTIIECLTIQKNIFNKDVSIQTLLSNEIYQLQNSCDYDVKLQNLNAVIELLNTTKFKSNSSFAKEKETNSKIGFSYICEIFDYYENVNDFLKNHHSAKFNLEIDEILELNLTEIVCELVYKQNLNPDKLINFVYKMKANLPYMLAVNATVKTKLKKCDITLWKDDIVKYFLSIETIQGKNDQKKFETCNLDVFSFMKIECFLLAYLLKKVYEFNYQSLKYTDSNIIQNLKSLDSVNELASLYEHNIMISCLNYDCVDIQYLLEYVRNNNFDFEKTIKVLSAISPMQYRKYKSEIDRLKNYLIEQYLESSSLNDEKVFELLQKITNINMKAKLLLKHLEKISNIHKVEESIENLLNLNDIVELEPLLQNGLEIWIQKLKLYKKIINSFEDETTTWLRIRMLSDESPERILQQLLIKKKNYELCFEWIKLHPLKIEDETTLEKFKNIFVNVLNSLEDNTKDNVSVYQIIETFPQKVQFYKSILPSIRKLHVLNYVTNCISENIQNYKISYEILTELSYIDEHLWNLIQYPLIIIEQCLMNMKVEILSKIKQKIAPLLSNKKCLICFKLYDKILLSLNDNNLLFNVDNHKNCLISSDCIDLLLRIYASKALEFKIVENPSSIAATNMIMEDGLSLQYKTFQMPSEIPSKSQWVPDREANVCMVCKISKFTLLNRRHHCRRCGRVCCGTCSNHRTKLQEMYLDIMVRVCSDCFHEMEIQSTISQNKIGKGSRQSSSRSSGTFNKSEWHLSGIQDHDNLIREDFSYEYSPNVGLFVAFCDLHNSNDVLTQFLMYHSERLKKLLIPVQRGMLNPEIDYELVAQMLHVLTISVMKISQNIVVDHADVILSMVKNGCDMKLLPVGPLDANSLRKLRDTLVRAEKFEFAMELSLKCGFSVNSVIASWGISCLKAGMFKTARKKLALCMNKINDDLNVSNKNMLASLDTMWNQESSKRTFKNCRPSKSSPLLIQVKNILENLYNVNKYNKRNHYNRKYSVVDEDEIRSKLKQKEVILCEPASNIKNSLANLKSISKGSYDDLTITSPQKNRKQADKNDNYSRFKENCYLQELMYYLATYAGYIEIIQFLVEYSFLKETIKFVQMYNISPDIFVKYIYVEEIKRGNSQQLFEFIHDLNQDNDMKMWRKYFIETCRFLEQNKLYNCLYNLQIMLKDPIRAAITCVRFYSDKCTTFSDLQNNSFHLTNAQKHLQSQLEVGNWNTIKMEREVADSEKNSFIKKMDLKTINGHINTISRQLEVTKFLSASEKNGSPVLKTISKLRDEKSTILLPTLFGSYQDKILLAVLTLVCGKNIDEGFGLSYRIIQDFNLKSSKVYEMTALFLGSHNRLEDVPRLIENIKSNDIPEIHVVCDLSICAAINAAFTFYDGKLPTSLKQMTENLINGISDAQCKVKTFFETGQLKAAYLLAVQISDAEYLKKIYKQAQKDKNDYVIKLCERRMMKTSESHSIQSNVS